LGSSLSLRCGGKLLGLRLRLGLETWLLLGLRSGTLWLGLESLLLLGLLLKGRESRELLGLRCGLESLLLLRCRLLESLLLRLRCRCCWPSLGWGVFPELFQGLTLFRTELLLLMSNLRLLCLYKTLMGLKLSVGGLEGAGLRLGGCLGLGSRGKLLLGLSWDKLLWLRCWLGLSWRKLLLRLLGLRNKPLRLSGKLLRLGHKLLLLWLLRCKPLRLWSKLLLLRPASL